MVYLGLVLFCAIVFMFFCVCVLRVVLLAFYFILPCLFFALDALASK